MLDEDTVHNDENIRCYLKNHWINLPFVYSSHFDAFSHTDSLSIDMKQIHFDTFNESYLIYHLQFTSTRKALAN